MVSDEEEGGELLKLDSNILINVLKEMDSMGVKETLIKPRDGGWDMHAMDPANVSITTAFIKPAAFPEGSTLDEDVTISVPFLLDVLQKDQICDISFDGGNLTVKYDKSKRTKRLVGNEDRPRPCPNPDGLSTCVLTSDDIVSVAKQKCFETITTDNGGITLRMNDAGVMFESISQTESAQMQIEGTSVLEDGEQIAIYPVSVLLPLLRALPKGLTMTMNFRTDFPICLKVDEDTYLMDIFVAPLIPQE